MDCWPDELTQGSPDTDGSTPPGCDSCDGPIEDTNRIVLSSTHEGACAKQFRDVDRQICLDCLAAFGMLEFVDDRTGRDETPISLVRNRLPPVRSLRGDV